MYVEKYKKVLGRPSNTNTRSISQLTYPANESAVFTCSIRTSDHRTRGAVWSPGALTRPHSPHTLRRWRCSACCRCSVTSRTRRARLRARRPPRATTARPPRAPPTPCAPRTPLLTRLRRPSSAANNNALPY